MAKRDTFTYDFKVGDRIVHSGITDDIQRREQEHRLRWPRGKIEKIGAKKTREGALEWEKRKLKTRTP